MYELSRCFALFASPAIPTLSHSDGEGKNCEIRHPEMVRVGKDALLVFSFVSDDPAIWDRWDLVSLLLIERLEHLDVPAKT